MRESKGFVRESKERRAEPREHADGQISLQPESFPKAGLGRMLDRSPHGFRASHDYKMLATGQEVHFVHGGTEGRARVVWTRIVGDHVESGFFILSEMPAEPPPRSRTD